MIYIPIIQALKKLRQEDHKFQASLGYIVSSRVSLYIMELCLKKKIIG
jgi:hypothetical protein